MKNNCYVCFGSSDILLQDICACRSFIHQNCLKKILQNTKDEKCRVCKQTYNNVKLTTRTKCDCSNNGVIFTTLLIIVTIYPLCIYGMVRHIVLYLNLNKNVHYAIWIALFCSIIVFLLSCVACVKLYRRGKLCVKKINVPVIA
jgi:hypothetical protein